MNPWGEWSEIQPAPAVPLPSKVDDLIVMTDKIRAEIDRLERRNRARKPQHLTRIIEVNQRADLAAMIVSRQIWTFQTRDQRWKRRAFPTLWHQHIDCGIDIVLCRASQRRPLAWRIRAVVRGFLDGFVLPISWALHGFSWLRSYLMGRAA
jgi:hypothetical protein